MSKQLKKILHRQYCDASSPTTPPVVVKNEMDVAFSMDNQEEQSSGTFYNRSNRTTTRFSGRRGNGRRGRNRNSTRSTDKNLNPLGPEGNTTKCFTCGCKFHWARECPYTEDTSHKKEDNENILVSNLVLMSQQKGEDGANTFLGETLGSAVLDSGASGTVCGKKWYECFLETIPEKQKNI